MSVVVLAPHTDDETLLVGGTLAKFSEQDREVYVYAFSCGTASPYEFQNACRVLDAQSEFLNFKNRTFSNQRQVILDKLIDIREKHNPSVVFVPASTDCHQDHHVIYEEGKRAFKHCTIYGYEAPWNSFGFSNTCYVRLTEEHISKKVAAMQEYKSQLDRPYFQGGKMVDLARVRGLQSGSDYAECFEVIRQYL